MKSCPKCLLLFFSFGIGNNLDWADCSSASRVNINNLKFYSCAVKNRELLITWNTCKWCRNKHSCSLCRHKNTAANYSRYCTLNDFVCLFSGNNIIPTLYSVIQTLWELEYTVLIICFHNNKLDFVAYCNNILALWDIIWWQIVKCNNACLLSAWYVNKYFGRSNSYYCTCNYLAVVCFLKRLVK